MALCVPAINYHLKSEVSIMLCCQLCSTNYIALRIKNCSKSTAAIKVGTMKNTDNFRYGGNYCQITLFAVSKDERDTKEDTGRMHCMYCSVPKGTCPANTTPNSEKIRPVALAIIKLHLSESISYSQSVN